MSRGLPRLEGLNTVIFDLNGTILDDWPRTYASVQAVFKAFGVKAPTEQEWKSSISSKYMEVYWKFGIPSSVTADEVNVVRNAYVSEHWNDSRPCFGAEAAIPYCREKYNTALITAEAGVIAHRFLDTFNLGRFFRPWVICDASPKRPVLEWFLKGTGISPEEAVFIDDTHEGVKIASEIGMRTIALVGESSYNTEEYILAAKPTVVIKHLPELFFYL